MSIKMAVNTKVIGSEDKKMVQVYSLGLPELSTKVNLLKTNVKAAEHSDTRTDLNTKGNGKMIKKKALEDLFGRTEAFTKVTFLTISIVDRVNSPGLLKMTQIMMASGLKVNKTVTELLHIVMAASIKVNGIITKDMVKAQ